MLAFLARRLVALALTLLGASLLVFLMLQVAPGDPATAMMGVGASPEAVAALREELGLNAPLWTRYLGWLAGFLTGDLGVSYTYRTPVSALIAERLAITGPLTLAAMALSIAIAVPLGAYAAGRKGTVADAGVVALTQAGVAIPNFWLAILLVFVFSTTLRWAGAGGFPGWEAGLGPALGALILPTIALALPQAAILTRVMRASLLETLGEDFVRTARAKGLSPAQALARHALPNALIPLLTILGLQLSFLLAGGIIIENVFYLPGLGRLVFQAIAQRDLIVVQSVVMLLVIASVVIAFLVDLAYAAIDPRLRDGRPA